MTFISSSQRTAAITAADIAVAVNSAGVRRPILTVASRMRCRSRHPRVRAPSGAVQRRRRRTTTRSQSRSACCSAATEPAYVKGIRWRSPQHDACGLVLHGVGILLSDTGVFRLGCLHSAAPCVGERGRRWQRAYTGTGRAECFPTSAFNSTNYWVDVVFDDNLCVLARCGYTMTAGRLGVRPNGRVPPRHRSRSRAAGGPGSLKESRAECARRDRVSGAGPAGLW